MGNQVYILISLISLIIITTISVIIYLIYSERKRTEAFAIIADNLGFTFYPKGDKGMLQSLASFSLFNKGRHRKITNLMFRELEQSKVFIFDYQYTVGTGRSSSTYKITVMGFQSDLLDLPTFYLRPENFLDKIAGKLGFEDIDFDTSEEFSKSYLLKGEDEYSIRNIFNELVISFYETHKGICTEGKYNTLIYYQPNHRVKPEQIHDFMDLGYTIFDLFNRVQN